MDSALVEYFNRRRRAEIAPDPALDAVLAEHFKEQRRAKVVRDSADWPVRLRAAFAAAGQSVDSPHGAMAFEVAAALAAQHQVAYQPHAPQWFDWSAGFRVAPQPFRGGVAVIYHDASGEDRKAPLEAYKETLEAAGFQVTQHHEPRLDDVISEPFLLVHGNREDA